MLAKIPHASRPKNQNRKQKQHCNKFNKDFKNGPHQKNLLKKVERIIDKEAEIGHAQELISHRLETPFSDGKESAYNARDPGSIPGSGRFPGEGNSYPLQYSGLENSMVYIVHVVAMCQTQLSSFHLHFQFSSVQSLSRVQPLATP